LIRILVAEDNEMVRMALKLFILTCEDMILIGEAHNGHEAVELVAQHQPDILLMDLMMPDFDGIEATRVICRDYPTTKILGLTNTMDVDLLEEYVQAGCLRCLPKIVTIDELEKAIRWAYEQAA
jgi:two-component system, NarL family, response regulator LiaR